MNRWLSCLPLVILTFALIGCSEAPADEEASQVTTQPAEPLQQAPANTGQSGVQVYTGGAGGAAPVTGTESLQGAGGGGVNQAAKNKARDVAGSAGGSSLDQLGEY